MNSIGPMNFFRTTDTTDTTIWKPGFNNKVTSSIRDTISMETESILKRYQMWSVLKTAHFLGFSCRVNGETASL